MKISLKITLILSLLIAFIWLYNHVETPRIDDNAAYTEAKYDGADYVDPWCLQHNCKG